MPQKADAVREVPLYNSSDPQFLFLLPVIQADETFQKSGQKEAGNSRIENRLDAKRSVEDTS